MSAARVPAHPSASTAGEAAGPTTTAPLTELTARRLGPVRRYFVRHPVAMDLLIMVLFWLPSVISAVHQLVTGDDGGLSDPARAGERAVVAGIIGPTLGMVALFWRRRRPVVVAATMALLGVACLLAVGGTGGFELGLALALYAVAASRGPRVTWLTFGAGLLALMGAAVAWETELMDITAEVGAEDGFVISETGTRITTASFMLVMALLAVAIGTSVRNRREHVAEIIERANALARDRDQRALLARAAERSRIAREMHDVVAHSISVMIALADGAAAALERSPESSRTAVRELSATGRSALADMRRVLGVLDGDGGDEPQPGEVDLPRLVERFRTAGLPVHATGVSTPLPTDPGVRLAAHRIVSEALTNALRHAPGTPRVDLVLDVEAAAVTIEVTDHGPRLPVRDAGGSGQGIVGMSERAAVHGGRVEAGPWDGGWRVHAVLPRPTTKEDT